MPINSLRNISGNTILDLGNTIFLIVFPNKWRQDAKKRLWEHKNTGNTIFYSSIRKKIYTHEETRVSFFFYKRHLFFCVPCVPYKKNGYKWHYYAICSGTQLGTQWEHNFFLCSQTKNPLPLCVKKENGGNGRKKSRCLLEKFNSDAITTCFCFTDFS